MAYVPYKHGTLYIPSGNNDDDKHLFFILNDACAEGKHLLVNVTTIYEGVPFDPACVVEPGEHPFIRHKSSMNYRMARIMEAVRITKYVGGWYYKDGEDASKELVEKIIAGALESEFLPKHILKYLAKLGY